MSGRRRGVRRSARIANLKRQEVSPKGGISVRRPPRGLCSGQKGDVSVEHHTFSRSVKSKQARLSALKKSFAIPHTIGTQKEIEKRVSRAMCGLCTDIPRSYTQLITEWACDMKGILNFDTLTSVKVDGKLVGFLTLNNSKKRDRSTNVLLVCAKSGCGGYVYDLAEENAISRGFNHVTLSSVCIQYGFYRRKGFRCVTQGNRKLDVFWDEMMKIPRTAGKDGTDGSSTTKRRSTRSQTIISSKLRKELGNGDPHHAILARIFKKMGEGHLINIVVQLFNGSVDAFLKRVDHIDINWDYTIDMEKNIGRPKS